MPRQSGASTGVSARVAYFASPRMTMRAGFRVALAATPNMSSVRLVGGFEFGATQRVSKHSMAGLITSIGTSVRTRPRVRSWTLVVIVSTARASDTGVLHGQHRAGGRV